MDTLIETIRENNEHDADMHAKAAQAACAGVPTADLLPGRMAELIRENAALKAALRLACDRLKNNGGMVPVAAEDLLNGETPKPTCTHEGYDFAKHGRARHQCGAILTDFGD